MNLTVKMNLLKIAGAKKVDLKSKGTVIPCIVIPCNSKGISGNKFGYDVTFAAWENKKEGKEYTHLIKQQFSKEDYEKMGEDERNEIPITGTVWERKAEEPKSTEVVEIDDDLPF